MSREIVISAGEVVWDIFPERRVLGGAPINVAYHLNCIGVPCYIITKIGKDDLGDQTVSKLKELGLALDGLQRDSNLPTGKVNVTIDEQNEPHFDIVAPAAWDAIELEDAENLISNQYYRMVYGTLAQRDERSRNTITELLKRAKFTYYDVNLRPPFTTKELVLSSLEAADLVKLNNTEVITVGQWVDKDVCFQQEAVEALLSHFQLQAVVVTAGADGAWVVTEEGSFETPGIQIVLADTVGAGDAFFSAIIAGHIAENSWPEILQKANQRGAYVASKHGATPDMEKF